MKVLIADNHWILRAGLIHLLSLIDKDVEVRETSNLGEALAALGETFYDICLVDPDLNPEAPLDALRQFRKTAPTVPLAVITTKNSRHYALQVVDMGAQAYILKSAGVDEIRHAIERVLAGEISLPANLKDEPSGHGPGLSDAPISYGATNGHSPLTILTPRQRDVLNLIATGKRNADIGNVLNISPRTVQIHVSTILKLLGVGNRTEAALLARRHGIGA